MASEYLHILWQGIYDVLRMEKNAEEAQALLSNSVEGCGLQLPTNLENQHISIKQDACLRSIFKHVKLNHGLLSEKKFAYLPMPLYTWSELERVHGKEKAASPYFPLEESEAKQKAPDCYKELIKHLAAELEKMKSLRSEEAYKTVLFELCKKYMFRLPARHTIQEGAEYISLFDEVRVAAAKQAIATQQNTTPAQARYVLLKGDFKGIQDFIYGEVSQEEAGEAKGTARNLRARSFLVSFLTDYFAGYILEKLGLEAANLLYAGGGHFLLLASLLPEGKSIEEIEQEINELLKQFGSATFLLAATEPLSEQDLDQHFSSRMQELGFALQRKKAQAHLQYLPDILESLKKRKGYSPSFMEKLGRELPYLDALIELRFDKNSLSENEKKTLKEEALFHLETKTDTRYFFPYSIDRKEVNKPPIWEKKQAYRVIYLNYPKPTAYIPYDNERTGSYTYRLFGTYAPSKKEKDGHVRTLDFSELAALSYNESESLSYPLLGVLRLDVDNLGALFEIGLGEKASVLHTASLSRELAFFFSHYINYLAEQFQIYVLYAGGDDAFVVGSWYNILHFADELRQRFSAFCVENKNLTFSAGIFFCHDHFPVPKFAELAAEAEEAAKGMYALRQKNCHTNAKNAVSVFGVVMGWGLYSQMLKFAGTLLKHTATQEEGDTKEGKISRSMVHRILRIIKVSFKNQQEVDVMELRRSMVGLHYWFARRGYTHEVIEKAELEVVKEVIKVILQAFSEKPASPKDMLLRAYILPTSYVLIKTRKLKN
ncbi:CRISPR-associated protein Csm1 [Thermonema lapsum]|uniref:CRISPR system single-strand-specific deoxyribonuclease Cas10/Csm1 (subtype III-A) n=1 Tax=Thermonema lapsum TaxID=28195 RepID=A0A846MR49_9BACT|nr:hypothetical protein [Thermonema lapsum]NIK73935.1 CRISPR-associated protein Csm1 [Thermonema lapsum]